MAKALYNSVACYKGVYYPANIPFNVDDADIEYFRSVGTLIEETVIEEPKEEPKRKRATKKKDNE